MRRRRGYARISPYDKRHDNWVGAQSGNSQDYAQISNGNENTFFGVSPTWMPGSAGVAREQRTGAYMRNSDRIDFTGYRETLLITVREPVIHRRIAFWTYEELDNMRPVLKQSTTASQTYYRNINPLTNDANFRSFLFQGTQGTDYTIATIHQAKLKTENFTVAFDRTRTINPAYEHVGSGGHVNETKYWFRGGRILYQEREQGQAKAATTGWSTLSRSGKGNLYVIDVFNSPGNSEAIGQFQVQGTRYWKEG